MRRSLSLLDVLQGFVHELRTAGLPVSMTENLDAMRAIEFIPIDDREMFKGVLSATLVKHERHQRAFETVFEVYFSLFSDGVAGRRRSTSSPTARRASSRTARRRAVPAARRCRAKSSSRC